MAARSGVSHLVDVLRGMTESGTADYTIGTANYWDDDHMQYILDNHRTDVYHEELGKVENWNGGTIRYLDYVSRYKNLEKTTGGTAIFIIEDRTGADVGTANYSVDYFRGRITFGSDTGGSVLYLTCRSYDLDGAASEIWKSKASHAANLYDFSTDNHRFARSQYMQHCLDMANRYAQTSSSSTQTTVLIRSDVNANALD